MNKTLFSIIIVYFIIFLNITVVFSQEIASGANSQSSPYEGVNDAILLDFNTYEGAIAIPSDESPTTENANVALSPEDMTLANWRVKQNDSATNAVTMINSFCKKCQRDDGTSLGAVIRFPEVSFASKAIIEPRFAIQPFNSNGQSINSNNGVIRNVNKIKEIKVNVDGRGYKVALSIRLRNDKNQIIDYYLGILDFNGWKELKWINPDYNGRVDGKRSSDYPVYPLYEPFYVFDSFVINRFDGGYCGDFIIYIKDVKVSYDVAVPKTVKELIKQNDDEHFQINKSLFSTIANNFVQEAKTMKRLYEDEKARKGSSFRDDKDLPLTEKTTSEPPITGQPK